MYAGARNPADITATTQRPLELDVTEEGDITAAIDRIDEAAGRLDILVNNAGIMDSREPLAEMPTDVAD